MKKFVFVLVALLSASSAMARSNIEICDMNVDKVEVLHPLVLQETLNKERPNNEKVVVCSVNGSIVAVETVSGHSGPQKTYGPITRTAYIFIDTSNPR